MGKLDFAASARRRSGRHGLRAVAQWLALVAICVWQTAAWGADPVEGRKAYMTHCKNCHGTNGASQMPGIPDFSRGEALLQPDMVLVETIRRGSGMMPAYRGLLTDDELLDIVAFLRTLR